ncbi:MAG: DNA mismatch repair protein MutS [Verrucomicrobia bacterium]|nr:DNA mismatch repair protein MutS [Verrucomicrobiota bacterium]
MFRQYRRIRAELPTDVLLFFRLGDFYELFGDDAKTAAPILNVALTKRHELPMCGVPYHALDAYLGKLIRAGRRVAICDQKGEVKPGQLVEREVTQVLSAGTVTDARLLDAGRNNYLAAAWVPPTHGGKLATRGFAYLDLTTGAFHLTELASPAALLDELARVAPAEFLIADDPAQSAAFANFADTRAYDAGAFNPVAADHALREHFGVQSLDGFGCGDLPHAVTAAGALLHYLQHVMRRPLGHVVALKSYRADGFLALDAVSQMHLEIVRPRAEGGTSLLAAIDRTVTPLGARRLRQWLLYPLRDLVRLNARQALIAAFLARPGALGAVRETLRGVRDLERTVGRLSQAAGNARDLLVLHESLATVPALQAQLATLYSTAPLAQRLGARLHPLPELVQTLHKALMPEPPASLRDGGIFRDGWNVDLDELRRATREGKDWIAALQEKEIARTGISSLKIRYNSVFGYFIEITKANLARVPADYHRKQTTANGERFITPELKDVETRLLGAEERARTLEAELFVQLRDEALAHVRALQETADALGTLDALAGLAETARLHGYCRPTLREEGGIAIAEGRHPVLDQQLAENAGGGKFVPNDVRLDAAENRLLILTGPNMAGKSTYLRQTALLVLLAQIGSFIPAREAEIGLVDRIFTRVGASDDLARGQSTFLVEMNETARILHHATPRSLVILDEIGRGTSTYDGLSIAWSVAEYLHDKVGALTLFATHYHELTELAKTHAAAKNFTVAVREWNDEIVFLHRIMPGAADKSYGIHVARLAGMPAPVLDRAREILQRLEASDLPSENIPRLTPAEVRRRKAAAAAEKRAASEADRPQLSLF